MSLINDALKKAARQRAEEQADFTPLMPGGGGSRARQGAPMRTQTMVLIGAAAVALVVVSVVVTGAFVTSKPEPKAAAAVTVPAASRPVETSAVAAQPAPVIALTVPKISAPSPTPTAAPTAAPTVAPVVVAQPTPAPVVAASAPAATAVSGEGNTEQVQAYVDGLHVTGARSAGTDSKALVDGHVFKVNDMVNKAFGLRLSRVDADQLTFVDATGATYVRSY
jgi:hypothetical protein